MDRDVQGAWVLNQDEGIPRGCGVVEVFRMVVFVGLPSLPWNDSKIHQGFLRP